MRLGLRRRRVAAYAAEKLRLAVVLGLVIICDLDLPKKAAAPEPCDCCKAVARHFHTLSQSKCRPKARRLTMVLRLVIIRYLYLARVATTPNAAHHPTLVADHLHTLAYRECLRNF